MVWWTRLRGGGKPRVTGGRKTVRPYKKRIGRLPQMREKNDWQKKTEYATHNRAKTLSGLFFALAVLLLTFSAPLFADAVQAAEVQSDVMMNALNKSMQGTVGAHNSQGFAFVYSYKGGVEKEIWFPFFDDVNFVGYANKEEMTEGDHVSISYDEAVDGSVKRLRVVNLQSKAEPVEPEVLEIEAPEEEIPAS